MGAPGERRVAERHGSWEGFRPAGAAGGGGCGGERRCAPRACAGVLQCERSAATPGVLAISYSDSWLTSGFIFSSSDSGWPMPPAAPSTATCDHVARAGAAALATPRKAAAPNGKKQRND